MKDKKSGIVPKIRFPQFRSSEGWSKTALKQLSDRITEKVGEEKLTTLSISAGIGFLSQSEKFSRDISGNQYRNYIRLEKGDFSYNKGNSKRFPQGCIYELREYEKAAVPNAFVSFRFHPDVVSGFYKGYFERNFHGKQLEKYITSGARSNGLLNINAEDFFRVILPTPKEREEQQKIAACVESLEELIRAENKKLEALKEHKAGLMQKLFPAEEKAFPELRFGAFSGQSIAFKNGNELFEPISNKDHKCDLPVLAISQKYGAIPREKVEHNVFVSDKSLESYKVVEIGDFIISLRSFQGGIEYSYHRGICSPAYIVLRKKTDLVDQYFRYYFKTPKFIRDLNKNLEGIRDGKMVSYSQFSELLLPVPEQKEQERIADCLQSIDELLAGQTAKIESLQNHKKGLLQQLFPSVEEVLK